MSNDPTTVIYRQWECTGYKFLEIFSEMKISLVTCLPKGDSNKPPSAMWNMKMWKEILWNLNVKRNIVKLLRFSLNVNEMWKEILWNF